MLEGRRLHPRHRGADAAAPGEHRFSLLLLHNGSRPLADGDLAFVQAFADTDTIGLIQARTIRQDAVNEQLHTALQSRIVIEQAKGILAARHNITVNQAFDALRHHARHHRILLSKVARGVIDRGLMPPPAPAQPKTSTIDTE